MNESIFISEFEEENNQAQRKARLARWRLQREVQVLLPEERVAFCMRQLLASKVDVCYSPSHKSAHYQGLMVCGSVWVCPLCAARISERRRVELEQAIATCVAQGGAVYLATYTVSHKQYDALSDLLGAFLAARKRAKQGRAAQELQKQFGILGTVSVREVTWSEHNGWHPHCHELVFCAGEIDIDAYTKTIRQLWERSAEHEGLHMNEHGFQLARTYGAVADYIAKFGRKPFENTWGAAEELTKAHLKRGRQEEHFTPFAMLEQIAQGVDTFIPLFLEYAQWFKGKRQLVWSPGLRARLLASSEEASDFKIAQDKEEEEILLGQLSRAQWSIVLRKDAPGKLLEVARTGDWQQVQAFLCSIRADCASISLLLGITTKTASQPPTEQCESTQPVDNSHQYIERYGYMQPGLCKKMKNGVEDHRTSLRVDKKLIDNGKMPLDVNLRRSKEEDGKEYQLHYTPTQQRMSRRRHSTPDDAAALAAWRGSGVGDGYDAGNSDRARDLVTNVSMIADIDAQLQDRLFHDNNYCYYGSIRTQERQRPLIA